MHVLVIDHPPLVAALRRRGYTVHVAAHAAHALVGAQPWDVVVLAAERANFGACAELRERLGDKVIIVVVLNDDTPIRRATIMQLGADDVVGVPYNEREVVARIDAHLRRRTMGTV